MRGLLVRVFVLLCVLSPLTAAQDISNQVPRLDTYDFSGDYSGGGVRAKGMGNAFIAISDDISAISLNPAGLRKFEKPVIGFSMSSVTPHGKYNPMGITDGDIYEMEPIKSNVSLSQMNFLGFLSPMRIRGHHFVFSLAYSRSFSDYSKVGMSFQIARPYSFSADGVTIFDTTYTADVNAGIERTGTPYTVSLGFGTRLSQSVDIGIAVNTYMGHLYSSKSSTALIEGFKPVNIVGNQTVAMLDKQSLLDTFKYAGVNFTFGLKTKFSKLDFGVIIKTGFDLKLKGGSTLSDTMYYNSLPAEGGYSTLFVDNRMVKMSQPWILGVGFGYSVSENMLVSLDAEYRPFSGKKVSYRDSLQIRPGGNNVEWYTPIDYSWSNSLALRTGMEYIWKTGNTILPIIPIRAGLGYVPLASPSLNWTTGKTETVNQFKFSLGTGVRWSQINLDVAYVYSSYSMYLVLPVGEGLYAIGKNKPRNSSFDVMFTGYF